VCIGIFCYAIVVILWLLAINYLAPHPKEKYTQEISALLNNAQTGDLIFLCADSFATRGIRLYTWCPYSHVGMIIRAGDDLFLWEADYGSGYKNGPRVMKLEEKLKRYKGYPIIGWRQWKGSPINTDTLIDIMKKYMTKKMDTSLVSWVLPRLENSETTFCSKLIASTLADLGYLKLDAKACTYSPKWFLLNLVNLYTTPYYVIRNTFSQGS